MKRKYKKGTEKIRREPPVFEFGGGPCEVGSHKGPSNLSEKCCDVVRVFSHAVKNVVYSIEPFDF